MPEGDATRSPGSPLEEAARPETPEEAIESQMDPLGALIPAVLPDAQGEVQAQPRKLVAVLLEDPNLYPPNEQMICNIMRKLQSGFYRDYWGLPGIDAQTRDRLRSLNRADLIEQYVGTCFPHQKKVVNHEPQGP